MSNYSFDTYVSTGSNGTIGFSGLNPSAVNFTIPTTTNATTGTWYHIAFVVNSGTNTMYVNGQQYGTGTYPNEYTVDQLRVGMSAQYYGHAFAGVVDDLRVYNLGLNASQIALVYGAGGLPYNSPCLLGVVAPVAFPRRAILYKS